MMFADKWDYLFTTVACLASILHGVFLPLLILIFGRIVDMFLAESTGYRKLEQISWDLYNTTKDQVVHNTTLFGYLNIHVSIIFY